MELLTSAIAYMAASSLRDWLRAVDILATLVISGAALYATLSIRSINAQTNDRDKREKTRSLKSEIIAKLIDLANVIAQHRELFQNTRYPIYSKDQDFEVVIRLNVGESDDDRTKEKSNINFLMVRHKERTKEADIMSFMYRGDQEVESSSIDFERVPGPYSNSEKWDIFIDALSSAINMNISGANIRNVMDEYHERDSDQVSKITGMVGRVRGHYPMNEETDKKLKNAIVGTNLAEFNRRVNKVSHIDARDMQGRTFLHYAVYDAYNRLWNTPQYENERGEDKRNINYASRMQNNLSQIISILLQNKADANSLDNKGVPVIYLAAAAGNSLAVDALRRFGADINAKSENGNMAALHIASFLGHVDVIRALLEVGADINIQVSMGRTSLHFAIENLENEELVDVVNLLIDGGADVNIKDQNGISPYDLIQELKKDGASVYNGLRWISEP